VSSAVTTTCCGLAIVVGLQLPVATPPAPSVAPSGPGAPSFDVVWRQTIQATGAVDLLATEQAILVVSPSAIEARSLKDGAVLWSVAQPSSITPARVGPQLFIAEGQSLSAIAIDTGKRTWTLPLDEPLVHVAAAGEWVIAVSQSSLRGVQARDGRQVWLRRMETPLSGRPALDHLRVYLATASRWAGWRWNSELAAWDLPTGTEQWRVPLEVPVDAVGVSRDRVFLRGQPRGLYSVNTGSGWIDWPMRSAIVIGRPALDTDTVYLALLDHTVLALDGRRGGRKWKTTLPGRPFTGPWLLGETLYIPIVSGEIAEVDRQSGTLSKRELATEQRPFQAFTATPDAQWVFALMTDFGGVRTLSALRRRR
jgi:outer membrane protein assembly factor BamB